MTERPVKVKPTNLILQIFFAVFLLNQLH